MGDHLQFNGFLFLCDGRARTRRELEDISPQPHRLSLSADSAEPGQEDGDEGEGHGLHREQGGHDRGRVALGLLLFVDGEAGVRSTAVSLGKFAGLQELLVYKT